MKTATTFLKNKGLVKEGYTDMIIKTADGAEISLVGLLEEYSQRRSFISRLLCFIGWHQYTCKLQDCIDEFGYVPSDDRMPKIAKCSRCGKILS